jgi:hypothetical protein
VLVPGFDAANAGPTPLFAAPVEFALAAPNAVPLSVAIADVTEDGVLDLISADASHNTVDLLAGIGNGTFAVSASVGVGLAPVSVLIADLNGDGTPDIVTANNHSTNVSVLIGTGGGAFGAAINTVVDAFPFSLAAADLNGDGIVDLVTANETPSDDVSVLLGNGDGTFGAATNFPVGEDARSVAIADLNGDVRPDLVVAHFFGPCCGTHEGVSTLLGNGDGTFSSPSSFLDDGDPFSVAVGDVNGDGTPDAVAGNEFTNDVSVFLGNGDGTLGAATNFPASVSPESVALSDVNADGTLDVVTANLESDMSVLLGNGDGTFATAVNFALPQSSFPEAVAANDVNGDGKPDVAVANSGTGTVSVFLNTSLKPQTISFGAIATKSVLDPDFGVVATASSALPVVLSSGTPSTCTIAGTTVHLVGEGTCTIQAVQAGNGIFDAAAPVLQSFLVTKAPQTITFPTIADHRFGDPDFGTAVTASSGLPVGLASFGACTTTGITVHLTSPGVCLVTATQTGNATFAAAAPAIRPFNIAAASTSLFAGPPPSTPSSSAVASTNGPETSGGLPSTGRSAATATTSSSAKTGPAPTSAVSPPLAGATEPSAAAPPSDQSSHRRAALAASLPTPGDIAVTARALAASGAMAMALVLLLLFPAELFNKTLEEHYDEITAGLNRWRRRMERVAQRASDLPAALKAFAMCAVGGLTCVFLDPQATLDPATIAFALGMTGALAVVVVAYQVPAKVLLERSGHVGTFATFPTAAVAGILFVVLSRTVSFQPGFAFGLIAGWVFASAADREEGRAIAGGAVFLLTVALLAWILWATVPVDVTSAHPSFAALVTDSFLASTFVAGIEGLVFALIPLAYFDGASVRKWSRSAHLALLLVGMFLFVHVLIGGTNYVGKSNAVSAGAVAVTFSAFATISVAFYAYWRWRDQRVERTPVATTPAM